MRYAERLTKLATKVGEKEILPSSKEKRRKTHELNLWEAIPQIGLDNQGESKRVPRYREHTNIKNNTLFNGKLENIR